MTIEVALLALLGGLGMIVLGDSGKWAEVSPSVQLTTGCQPEPSAAAAAAASLSCKSVKNKVGPFLCRKFQGTT